MPLFFVSHGNHTATVDTHFDAQRSKRDAPLQIAADILAVCAVAPTRGLLGLGAATPLGLRLPPGVALPLLGLAAGARLQPHVPVAALLAAGVGIAPQDGSAPIPLIVHVETSETADIVEKIGTHITAHYPSRISSVLSSIEALDLLLGDSQFLSTFGVGLDIESIRELFKEKLHIRFVSPAEYNSQIKERFPEAEWKFHVCDDEYGFYDVEADRKAICINLLHYTILPENENMEFLKCLAFLTAVHEIQHFVHSQLKVDSPSQPIVGRTPPIESGDEWEFRNILGIIGIGSAPGSMYTVTGLYLNRGATSPFVSTNYIQQMMEVLAGTRNFPLMEDPLLWTPDVSGIIRRKRKLLCHDKMSCDMANDEYGPDLMIRRTRPSDKKIRK